jgi:hypothetical protein
MKDGARAAVVFIRVCHCLIITNQLLRRVIVAAALLLN